MPNPDTPSIAEELSAQQREISIAEFFEQNRQMLGFGSKARSMVTAVKEGVDNAIDASEDAGILPEVTVTIKETGNDYYAVTIADNGPGITKEQVPKVFGKLLYGSRFSKRVQRRGQQGIGISAAVLYGQLTTGKSAEITSKIAVNDDAEYFQVGIDTDSNEPKIHATETVSWDQEHDSGTSITVYMEANFRARSSLHKYIKHTAIVNPHATVELNEPEEHVRFERTVEQLPKQPTEINPHPHGIEFGTLRSLIEVTDSHSISGFLQSEFTRVGQTTADSIINAFMDRVHGRYCAWNVPAPTEPVPIDLVSEGDVLPQVEHGNEGLDESSEDTTHETVTLKENIAAHVNRKSADATEAFASQVSEDLHERQRVSWVTAQKVTNEIADAISEEYNTTLGETVREKAASAAWGVIRVTREKTLIEIVDAATSDRKTDSDVQGFAVELRSQIDHESTTEDALTKTGIQNVINETADVTSTTISNAFGETATENVFNELWGCMERTRYDPPLLRKLDSDIDLADALHQAMQDVKVMAPPSHCLSPIGEESLTRGMKKVYDAEFYTASTRDASAHSGEPFLVEAGIAYGGDVPDEGDVDLLRFANRVPLVYQQGACCITNVVTGIRWNNYKLSDKGSGLPQGPVAIVVHIASTNVPFTSESKDAVASVEEIEGKIERAVRDVGLNLKNHLQQRQSLKERQRKQDKISMILPEFSQKIASISGRDEPAVKQSLAQIMNNVLVQATPDQDLTTVTATNYDNQSTHTPKIRVHMEAKPELDSSIEYVVEEYNGGWVITWEPSINSGETVSIELPVRQGSVEDVTVENIEAEKVTTHVRPEPVTST